MHPLVLEVTERLRERSRRSRARYLEQMAAAAATPRARQSLPCSNLAHAMAACPAGDKQRLQLEQPVNVGIVSAYNDLLSAHQPYARYPELIRQHLRGLGAGCQMAGGVPAMCDGITQGQPGMQLSLYSRDVIALSTAVALSHQLHDAVLLLGICDKIVPGMLMGALRFGHLPTLFVPSGPMPSGLDNSAKAEVRQRYAEGRASREELLQAEAQAYHAPGTCTFFGTANTNQLLLEALGLQLPGSSFITPDTPLRDALTCAAASRAVELARSGAGSLAQIVDERALVNALVMLLASGGSTNHSLHLPAIARAAGILLDWDDLDRLSSVVPTLAHIYPNGKADINQFQAAGGPAWLFSQLLDAGLLHADVETVAGPGLARYTREPMLREGQLIWRDGPAASGDTQVLRSCHQPFAVDGGLRLLSGRLGRGIIKLSAVAAEQRCLRAPCRVFDAPQQLVEAFRAGELEADLFLVVRGQGPQANGMPELHALMPCLGALQDRGWQVALVTDGRLSGASGKVPAALHLYPEAALGGPLARLQDGDRLWLDAEQGVLEVELDEALWQARQPTAIRRSPAGCGRELFGLLRGAVANPEQGASSLLDSLPEWTNDV